MRVTPSWRNEDGYIQGRPILSLVLMLAIVAVMAFIYMSGA